MIKRSQTRLITQALCFVTLMLALVGSVQKAWAHDLPANMGSPAIPDFSDQFPGFRTVGGVGVPNGNNGDNGIGFPIDPRDLIDQSIPGMKARVFHEHFRGDAPFDDTFHGTVVFTVFNGPNFTPCNLSGPIQPPDPIVYTNSSGTFSLPIDFSTVTQTGMGADDLGLFLADDWIYAYVVVNDEGENTIGTLPNGNDAIASNILSFASGLRRIATDLPILAGVPGRTIHAGGDIEEAVANTTTNIGNFVFLTVFGALLDYSQLANGDGCLPDTSDIGNAPADCNQEILGSATNIFFITSPFGPGVSNVSHAGGGNASVTEENVVLGPLTYPNYDCLDMTVNNLTRPGDFCIRTGDRVEVLVDVANPPPAANPPYGLNLPGGTQRGKLTVNVATDNNEISFDSSTAEVCFELDIRLAQARFTGTYTGLDSTKVSATVTIPAPYTLAPFDKPDTRFTVGLDDGMGTECEEDIFIESIKVEQNVQVVCFLDPNDPGMTELRPDKPTGVVDGSPCALVRFTVNVMNLTEGEALSNVRLSECFPMDILFRDNVMPATPMVDPAQGPPCPAGTTPVVFALPDLAAAGQMGDTYQFTFDAIVRAAAVPGLNTVLARVRGFGNGSGDQPICPADAEDGADVNVRAVSAMAANLGVDPAVICPPGSTTMTFQVTNDGDFPLDPVIIGAAVADPGLLISQNPPPGTNVGPLDPGESANIVIMVMAQAGAFPSVRCVAVPITAQPECYDPRDSEDCQISLMPQQCVDVRNPDLLLECLTTPDPVVDSDAPVTFQYRVTNTGDLAFSTVSFTCMEDATFPGIQLVSCPATIMNLGPGQSVIVEAMVRSNATGSGRQGLNVSGLGQAAGLPPECTATSDDTCFLIGRPRIMIEKEVQLVCFLDPNDPSQTQLIPANPVEQVTAPVCGLVRFTITATNPNSTEALSTVRVTDCLPMDLLFRGNIQPPLPTGGAGPPCASGTPTVFQLPNIAAGGSFTFTFDAIVRAASPAGLKINLARAQATGMDSGQPTNIDEDPAQVNVLTVDATLVAGGVNPGTICAPQEAIFTYIYTNTGLAPLEPVIVGAASLDPGLMLVDQTPPANTNVGPIGPGGSFMVVVTAKALDGQFPASRCVTVPVTSQPECYDPRDAENCRIDLTREQCVTVVSPAIDVTCLTDPPPVVDMDSPVTFQYKIMNTGDVAFDLVALECMEDPNNPGIVLVQCPPDTGPLAPGQMITVSAEVRSSPNRSGLQGLKLIATGQPTGLPAECNAEDMTTCFLIGRPRIDIEKQVQFVCFLNPDNPNQVQLMPPTPTEQVDAPVCGLVRFTITTTNPTVNEALRNVRVSDCLPMDLLFRNNIMPPLMMGGAGPSCPPGTTQVVFQLPNIAANGSFSFTFDAIVRAASPAGLKVNLARAQALGATSNQPTNIAEDNASVNVLTVSALLDAGGVNPDPICVDQDSTLTYTFRNNGMATLEPVIVGQAMLDGGLMLVSQNPPAGTNIGPVAPGGMVDITVVVKGLGGGQLPTNRCVRVPVTAQPDCYDPRDSENCRIDLTTEQCVSVFDPSIDVVCLTDPPPIVAPNTDVTFQFKITNDGDRAFTAVQFQCMEDPNNPGIVIVQCPPNLGALAPGAMVTVEAMVRSGANASGLQGLKLTATGLPAGLPAECNAEDMAVCFLSGRPQIDVMKQVQFVCFLDPDNPGQVQLVPPSPADQVDAPECGLVRFTITTTNQTVGEALTNVRVTDCLPLDLLFRNNIMPPLMTGGAGPDCGPGTTRTVFQLPDIAAGQNFVFTFDAIVSAASLAGLKTNLARAQGVGATSGLMTDIAEDTARVNVLTVSATLTPNGASPDTVCAGQSTTLSYKFMNNGLAPLEPVFVRQAVAQPGLTILSQNPPAGTNLGVLNVGQMVVVEVVVRAEPGMFPSNRCVNVPMDAQPECYDPRDQQDCQIRLDADECVTVVNPEVMVTCLTDPPPVVEPGMQTTFDFKVENTGDVQLDQVVLTCMEDPAFPGLTIVQCPPNQGPIAPGAMVTVQMIVRASTTAAGRQCAILKAVGSVNGLPPECNTEDEATCCLVGKPQIAISKLVQFVCFTDPNNPNATELRPPAPVESVMAPVCGLVRFTIQVDNPTTNEALTNVLVSDCLPDDLFFRGNIQPPLPTGGDGPPCGPGTTRTVFQLPNIPAGGSFTFTFDAIASVPGLKVNLARVQGTGVDSGVDTDIEEDSASVDVKTIDATLTPVSVIPESICSGLESTFTYRYENTGPWALNPVIVERAMVDAGLILIEQDPAEGANVGPLGPGESFDITVVVQARSGSFTTEQCVKASVRAQPDCYDPRDTLDCEISRDSSQCLELIDVSIDVTCLTPTRVRDRGEQVMFMFEIKNTGDVDCDGVTLTCALSPGLTLVSCPDDLVGLAAGASVEVPLVVTVNTGAGNGTLCATLDAVCDVPAGIPPECVADDSDVCCLVLQNEEIPTLGEWGLILMISAFSVVLIWRRRAGIV